MVHLPWKILLNLVGAMFFVLQQELGEAVNTIFIILGDFHDFDRYMHSTKA